MCWGVPARIIEVIDGFRAVVDLAGSKREVILGISDIVKGDIVLIHAGVVISKLSEEDVLQNLALYKDLIYHQLLEAGLNDGDARVKADEEINNLLHNLGIKGKIPLKLEVSEYIDDRGGNIRLPPPNSFKSRYKISLSDTDYLQVMHYTNYFRYCERAQQELLESIGFSYSTLIHRYGIFIPTVESMGKFKAPIRLDNEIEVSVWVEEIGKKHIKWRYLIMNLTSNREVGECYTISVCTDITLMESMELPRSLIEKLEKYVYKEE